MHFEGAVVFDETQLAKLVHESAYARPRGPNHLSKGLLADFCYDMRTSKQWPRPAVGQAVSLSRTRNFANIPGRSQDLTMAFALTEKKIAFEFMQRLIAPSSA